MAKPAPKTVQVLQVVGPAKGRWRLGRQFTQQPTCLVVADLTDEEIERLRTDPELTVVETQTEAPSSNPDPSA